MANGEAAHMPPTKSARRSGLFWDDGHLQMSSAFSNNNISNNNDSQTMSTSNNTNSENENRSGLGQPLLPPTSLATSAAPSSVGSARILDRDGTFSQSRGRWRVSNNTRQRRAPPDSAFNHSTFSSGGPPPPPTTQATQAIPYGVPTPTPRRRIPQTKPSFCKRLKECLLSPFRGCSLCCISTPDAPSSMRRCWDDWFHNLSYVPTCLLMLGVFAAYFVTIVVFAALYLTVNKVGMYYSAGPSVNPDSPAIGEGGDVQVDSSYCGMDINNHMEAMYFSLSTMATIGYGVSDYYFGECWIPFLLVLLQVFCALAFSSLAIGLLFQRMSRGQKRGRTIVFSDVAVIRKVRGTWYWMFRVAELRKRHIIGAKVRVFCVRHERCPLGPSKSSANIGGNTEGGSSEIGSSKNVVELETAYFVSHPLPLLNGSYSNNGASSTSASSGAALSSTGDEENSVSSNSDCVFEQSILMGLPHVVVHRMDGTSPMMPPRPIWYDENGVPHGPSVNITGSSAKTPPTQFNSTKTISTEASADSIEVGDDVPSTLLATTASLEQGQQTRDSSYPTEQEISQILQDRQAEIIIFLEGTCEITGMALQARHSYKVEDIAFHQTFAPCVFPATIASEEKKKKWWQVGKSEPKENNEVQKQEQQQPLYNFHTTALEIDFCQFHDLIPAPVDCMSCPYVPSSLKSR